MMVALADWTLLATLLLHLSIDLSSGLLPDVGRKNLIRQAAKNNENTREDEETIVVEFEKTLLNMFGLKRRPTPSTDQQIPRIMQHLYKAHMGDTYEPQENIISSWETGFDLPGDEITSKTNTARSFHHIDEDEHLTGMPENHIRLRFDVSSIPDHEVIGASELLLHREAVARHVRLDDHHIHRINIYEIIKLPDSYKNKVAKLPGGRTQEPITRLLDTRLIDSRNSTWERFDVSLASMKWARNKHEENHGLLVEVVRENDGSEPAGDHKSHVRLRRSLHQEVSNEEWVHGRPKLMTYSHDGKNTNLQRRSKRSSRRRDGNSSKKRRKKRRRRNCQRHKLYVDFKEVGWNDWIVAPHGYEAFFCEGICEFPLAAHMNATNHAIVQSFVNSVKPDASAKPCCVPTELNSLSMLYYDDQDIVLLKTYNEMVVGACGCR